MWNFTMWFSRFSLFGVRFKATRKSLCGFPKNGNMRFSLFGVRFKATRKSLCGFPKNGNIRVAFVCFCLDPCYIGAGRKFATK